MLGGKVYPEGGYVAELPARGNTGDMIIAKPGVNQSFEIQIIMLEMLLLLFRYKAIET